MSNLRLLDPEFGDSFDSMFRRFFPPSGVSKDDIDVRVEGNMVSIDAETRSEKEKPPHCHSVVASGKPAGIQDP